jgi:G3E family GTPase
MTRMSRAPATANAPPVPVTTIGGYLGAGKTTLLNNVLAGDHGLRIAILVNDFGAISIDEKLIVGRDGDVITLANGCACCTIAGDLAGAMHKLAGLAVRPDHILVEASGVAHPARIADMATSPGLASRGAIVMVDVETIQARARDKFVGRLVRDQIARADLVVLNKIDLVDAEKSMSVRDWIRDIAPQARMLVTAQGRVSPAILLYAPEQSDRPHGFCDEVDPATPQFESYCWTTRGSVDLDLLRATLASLPPQVLRAKGILAHVRGQPDCSVMHLVGHRLTIGPAASSRTFEATEIVVIALAGALDKAALDESFGGCVIKDEAVS